MTLSTQHGAYLRTRSLWQYFVRSGPNHTREELKLLETRYERVMRGRKAPEGTTVNRKHVCYVDGEIIIITVSDTYSHKGSLKEFHSTLSVGRPVSSRRNNSYFIGD